MEFAAFGKWILLGEHAVVRGNPALVFPLESRQLTLRCTQKQENTDLVVHADSPELEKAIFSALQKASEILEIKLSFRYDFSVNSSIPLRAGLGSSAALSVTLGRFLEHEGFVKKEPLFSLCQQMENVFHGTSSGIDIAAVFAGHGIRFVREEKPQTLTLAWKPKIYLTDTGERSSTADCVRKVAAMNRADLDTKMKNAVEIGTKALANPQGFADLKTAIQQGEECFREWDLIRGKAKNVGDRLLKAGAAAVKPTGSGAGGFLLSLWETTPPTELNLLPVFI